MNTLYYGDNLKILRDYIKDESVDLVYLDPPFNSNRNYNVLFKNESGTESESQITAFEETWHWNLQAEQTYKQFAELGSDAVYNGSVGKKLVAFMEKEGGLITHLSPVKEVGRPGGHDPHGELVRHLHDVPVPVRQEQRDRPRVRRPDAQRLTIT